MRCDELECLYFFFQAEDGIRDVERSRGLGDVYKRQDYKGILWGKVPADLLSQPSPPPEEGQEPGQKEAQGNRGSHP